MGRGRGGAGRAGRMAGGSLEDRQRALTITPAMARETERSIRANLDTVEMEPSIVNVFPDGTFAVTGWTGQNRAITYQRIDTAMGDAVDGYASQFSLRMAPGSRGFTATGVLEPSANGIRNLASKARNPGGRPANPVKPPTRPSRVELDALFNRTNL